MSIDVDWFLTHISQWLSIVIKRNLSRLLSVFCLFYFVLHPFTYFYICLSPIILSYPVYGLVWYGGGCPMTLVLFEFLHWILRWEMDLGPLYWLWKVMDGWVVVHLNYSDSSGPFFEFWDWDWRLTRTRAWQFYLWRFGQMLVLLWLDPLLK